MRIYRKQKQYLASLKGADWKHSQAFRKPASWCHKQASLAAQGRAAFPMELCPLAPLRAFGKASLMMIR
jgi:hypothetical protein